MGTVSAKNTGDDRLRARRALTCARGASGRNSLPRPDAYHQYAMAAIDASVTEVA
jgi:hypothetical protein